MDTKITPKLVKLSSGHFDLASVQRLILASIGIKRMEVLSECTSMTYLDLSHNSISKIESLETLKKLTFLDLRDNNIQHLDGIQKLRNLEILHISANDISQVEELKYLAFLKKLTILSIEDNPVVNNPKFSAYLHKYAPHLLKIDGERVQLKTIYYEILSTLNLDKQNKSETDDNTPSSWINASDTSKVMNDVNDVLKEEQEQFDKHTAAFNKHLAKFETVKSYVQNKT